MSADSIIFGLTAFVVIAAAMMVVLNRHPMYSALYLVVTFLGLAVFYLQLNAPFLAAVQVIVYAGAIMVLFLFVIMLIGADKTMAGEDHLGVQRWLGGAFAVVLIGEIAYFLAGAHSTTPIARSYVPLIHSAADKTLYAPFGSVQALGSALFSQYLFAFEATSVVLIIAMVGVVILAKKRL
ncbi:MAG: NADH-quinone oxidoreductase subunit J [Abditibacteriaceae bacterium]